LRGKGRREEGRVVDFFLECVFVGENDFYHGFLKIFEWKAVNLEICRKEEGV
jgi:hypothetical protein